MGTDHANDQKKLKSLFRELKQWYDREVRGECALLLVSPEELVRIVCELNEEKIAEAGGQSGWDALSEDEQAHRNKKVFETLCQRYGEKEFEALSADQKREANFFIWAGCCMHKDLNSHKGGNTRLIAFWPNNNLEGPMLLMNKDNAAAAAIGNDAAKKRAEEMSSAGAVKLLALLGALLNHKDDKKGQQDSTIIFFEYELGFTVRFPDTSNTRYQSYSDGAAETIVHLPIYIQFLEFVRNKKETRTWTNMERNIWTALHDIPTITELCVLTLYGQAVTHPYMRKVRGSQREHSNLLDLGPLHEKVKDHCRLLIRNPELLYGPEVSYEKASMDGKLWDRPEAIYAVQALANGLPHLRGALIAFLEGALETWERFSAEFAPGGEIANASAVQKHNAWMPTTNDHNEGALGALRVSKRKAPNMKLETYNARKMYKHNNTQHFMGAVLNKPADHQFLRWTARKIQQERREKQRQEKQGKADRALVAANLVTDSAKEEKKAKRTAKLASLDCVFDVSKLCSLNVKQMELQLAWHRLSDKAVPKCKELPRRAEKLAALTEAVERYNLREALLDGAAESSEPGARIQCGIDRDDVNLADDDWDMETE
jgi:hypothetical protein